MLFSLFPEMGSQAGRAVGSWWMFVEWGTEEASDE